MRSIFFEKDLTIQRKKCDLFASDVRKKTLGIRSVFHKEVRRLIYTTNTIESFNRQFKIALVL